MHLYRYLLTLYPKYTQERYIIFGCTEIPTKYLDARLYLYGFLHTPENADDNAYESLIMHVNTTPSAVLQPLPHRMGVHCQA